MPIRLQTEADLLAAADWALLAWEDPGRRGARPFWSSVPMLVDEPDPDPWPEPVPLLGLLAQEGARVEGLRLLDGRFVLKAELCNALLQILVPSGCAFGPGDGIMAKLGLSLPLGRQRRGRGPVTGDGAAAPFLGGAGSGEGRRGASDGPALGARKSVREVALEALGADATEPWDTDGGVRPKAKRRIAKARATMKGYRAFLEPGARRRPGATPEDAPGT